jgi:hypothetical protein
MRDDDANRPLPLLVVVQPDPMLEEHSAGGLQVALTALGATVIVVLALYGMSRPPEPQQMAAAPSEASQTAPAAAGASNAAAQNPKPNAQQPTTTGQGSSDKGPANKSQGAQSKTPPASGSSATSGVGPGAKPAPEAK